MSSTPVSDGDFAYKPKLSIQDDLAALTIKVSGLLQTMDLPPHVKATLQLDAASHSEAENSLFQQKNEFSMTISISGQPDSFNSRGYVHSIGCPPSIGEVSHATSHTREVAGIDFDSFIKDGNAVDPTGVETRCGAAIGHCVDRPLDVGPFAKDQLDLASFTFCMIKNESLSWQLYRLERRDCIGKDAYYNGSGAWKWGLPQEVIWDFMRSSRNHNIRIHGKGTCSEARRALGYDDSYCEWLSATGRSTFMEHDLIMMTGKLIQAYDEQNLVWRDHYSNVMVPFPAEDESSQTESESWNEDLAAKGFEIDLDQPSISHPGERLRYTIFGVPGQSQVQWVPQSYRSALREIPPKHGVLCAGEAPRCTFGLQRYVQLLTEEQVELAAWLVCPLASNPWLQWDIFNMPELVRANPAIQLCQVLKFEKDIETCLCYVSFVKAAIIETHKEGECPLVQFHDAGFRSKHDPSGLQNVFNQVAAIHADPSRWLNPERFSGWNEGGSIYCSRCRVSRTIESF